MVSESTRIGPPLSALPFVLFSQIGLFVFWLLFWRVFLPNTEPDYSCCFTQSSRLCSFSSRIACIRMQVEKKDQRIRKRINKITKESVNEIWFETVMCYWRLPIHNWDARDDGARIYRDALKESERKRVSDTHDCTTERGLQDVDILSHTRHDGRERERERGREGERDHSPSFLGLIKRGVWRPGWEIVSLLLTFSCFLNIIHSTVNSCFGFTLPLPFFPSTFALTLSPRLWKIKGRERWEKLKKVYDFSFFPES